MSIKSEIERIKANVAAAYTAVTGKGGTVPAAKTSANLASAIGTIPTGTDTSDATAVAGDILSGKTAYVKGAKVTGNIASKGAADLTASGAAVSVPAGYYPSAVSKSVATATQATPGISVSSGGLITASATQTAGYVAAGTKSATKQLTTKAAATITPGPLALTAVASGVYTTGAVTVAGDANLLSENIKSGVAIFNVLGTYTGSGSSGSSDFGKVRFSISTTGTGISSYTTKIWDGTSTSLTAITGSAAASYRNAVVAVVTMTGGTAISSLNVGISNGLKLSDNTTTTTGSTITRTSTRTIVVAVPFGASVTIGTGGSGSIS